MNFASDNSWGFHPAVLSAISAANDGAAMGYGADRVTLRAEDAVREALDAPHATVRFVATGTAANALVCAQLSPPHGRIYCHTDAHILTSECGAPGFYTHGATLIAIPGDDGLVRPEDLDSAIVTGAAGGLNGGKNAFISITNATEWGRIYRPRHLCAVAEVARRAGLPLHVDGARFANAVAAAQVSPADLSWRAGVDVLCLGGTKNGAIGAEAVVFFDPDMAEGFDYRRKQAGQVLSKSRFLAAQMLALMTDGLWLDLARQANAKAQRL
ncbi:MAG: beta-eliminating lyase-related protein, partial [Paracoccus sp. (in: a-proteobacteria)]|nr:beta-eliminating lyase-related protein [Paracoccus sp. (in: a-proteobacteria)]